MWKEDKNSEWAEKEEWKDVGECTFYHYVLNHLGHTYMK